MEIPRNKLELTLKMLKCWKTSAFPHLHSPLSHHTGSSSEFQARQSPQQSWALHWVPVSGAAGITSQNQCCSASKELLKILAMLRNLRHESLLLFQSHNRLHKNMFSNKTIYHYLQISDSPYCISWTTAAKQNYPVSKNLIQWILGMQWFKCAWLLNSDTVVDH